MNKMSELDRDGAKTLDDEDTDSIETIIEDNDDKVMVAEPTIRTAFQAELRSFFQLFNVTRDQLVLKRITDDKWDQSNDLWKSILDNRQQETTRQSLKSTNT